MIGEFILSLSLYFITINELFLVYYFEKATLTKKHNIL